MAKIKLPKAKPLGLQHIELVLLSLRVPYVTEHTFLKDRRFRFDVAIPELKIGIEYEGIHSAQSRHTNAAGYTTDCDKYNLAAVNGWRVLRFTARNYQSFTRLIEILIA